MSNKYIEQKTNTTYRFNFHTRMWEIQSSLRLKDIDSEKPDKALNYVANHPLK